MPGEAPPTGVRHVPTSRVRRDDLGRDSRWAGHLPDAIVHPVRPTGGARRDRHASRRRFLRHVRLLGSGVFPDGCAGQLPVRPRPGHGAQLFLRLHGVRGRAARHGVYVAGGLGGQPHRGGVVSGPQFFRSSRDHHACRAQGPEARHRRRHRLAHRVCRPSVRWHRAEQSGGAGPAGRPDEPAGPGCPGGHRGDGHPFSPEVPGGDSAGHSRDGYPRRDAWPGGLPPLGWPRTGDRARLPGAGRCD